MPAIVDYPDVVHQVMREFFDLFAYEPQRQHFAEYLTGLLVSERQTVLGMNRDFAQTTDQSCLNRFITKSSWNVRELNRRRLELLQGRPETRYSQKGVIAIDNTLIDREGLLIPDAGWYWDHAEDRYKIAQDFIFANYVCESRLHYPLDFRLFRKEAECQARGEPFQNHTKLVCQLIDWVQEMEIPGCFTFDCYFSSAEILNHIHAKPEENWQRGYVGDLKFNRNVVWQGKEINARKLAESIEPKGRKLLDLEDKQQWCFTTCLNIPQVNHRVRIVALWKEREDQSPSKMLVTNRVTWDSSRTVRAYRDRWTGTEIFHRDGKQELGMGDCQLRSNQGQTRHMHLVMLAYSLLVNQVWSNRASEWACQRLMTIGEACRVVKNETLRKTITWAIDQATKEQRSVSQIMEYLRIA